MNLGGNENEMTVANNYVTAEQIAVHRWSPITELPAIFFAKVGAAVMLNRKRLCRFPFLLDNNTMAYSLSSTKWDADFARALFGTVDLTSLVQVGALPSYNAGDVESMEIYLPSLLEQEQIGGFFKQLDNLITLHQRQPFLHSPPDISLIVQLTPPFYTFSWEQRKWINTVDISTNMVDPKSGKYDLLPHVAPGNIESFTGRLYDNVKLVGEENLISGKFVFNVGDIVYGKINPQLGKYVFARFSGLTSADAYVLNTKNGIVQKFLYAVIQTRDFYDYSVSVSKRSGMPKINRDELNAYSYWAPSESEQLKIGEYLLTLDHLITLHQRQTIVYAVIRSIRKVILAERQYFAPPMVRKSP